ncbi:MAG TPA: ATP-binding cassette domain-containing protein [Acidimicrobiales bacterium]|nr:ATP-binding cassette domain-containing protein [Acidimicrobiales bacterium]
MASRLPAGSSVLGQPPVTLAAWIVGFAMAWAVGVAALPSGLPFGVVLYGVVLGALSSLTAIGLILVYRSARIINFAQADIGGLAASAAVVMVTGWKLPYFAALPVGLAVAVATGFVIDATVVRRLFTAPRLILTVATIGVAQLIGAAEVGLPNAFAHLAPLTNFKTPFAFTFTVGPIVFNGNHVVAMVVVPVILGGLWWFFSRTDTGVAIRGAADSNERALLLGIPVRRLSRVTWMVAAGLSGVAAMLSAPILGPQIGIVAGPTLLLAPLAAAVVARMESIPVAFGASVGIAVFQQAIFWSYPQSSTVDVAMFALIMVALIARRRQYQRNDDGGLGGFVAVREVRQVPAALRRLPEVRIGRVLLLAVLVGVAVGVPFAVSGSRVILLTYTAIYAIIAVSLVVLTGWAGQISLGQFAFVGVGSAATGALLVHAHWDLLVALLVAAAFGALTAVLVGWPALRIPGLMLAVATMAFAVPVSSYLLNSAHFPLLNPQTIPFPTFLGRVSLRSHVAFYEFCLAVLFVAVILARNFRRFRPGRTTTAVRDNERGAAAYGISARGSKLTAFAFSGGLAGLAGGLYVVAQQGIGFNGYNVENSFAVFTMVVVGGLGSLPGALIGALYYETCQYFLSGAAQLLATGAGLTFLIMFFPGGLGELAFRGRDLLLRFVALRRNLHVTSLFERAGAAGEVATPERVTDPGVATSGRTLTLTSTPPHVPPAAGRGRDRDRDRDGDRPSGITLVFDDMRRDTVLECEDLDAGYGQVQVLFGVGLSAGEGEIVALLGTNGAGKSTVLRVLSGLLPASHGRVVMDGEDITALSPVERVRRGLVMVPGGRGVFPSLTVAENLRLGGWLRRRDPDLGAASAEVLALFPGLERRLATRAADLSGGEQQMLTLGQALLCQPRILMIDELSLGLAPTVVAELMTVVRRLAAAGTTVVVVEQSLNVAAALAERGLFLERGQVRFSGPVSDLADEPELARSVFLRAALPAASRAEPTSAASTGGARFEVRNIAKRYGGISALDEVSWAAEPGEVLGIIGANGAGKTTLFDVCSGFLVPDRGQVLLNGLDVTDRSAPRRARLGLGRMFQDARLFPSQSVAEVLAVALDRHLGIHEPMANTFGVGAVLDSEADLRSRVEELLETFGLAPYADAFVSELSTGTRRILELAGAVAFEPRVLLLDEPSSGIAQRESEQLAELLTSLRRRTGATLVVIEHDIPLVSSIADRLVCLDLGRVIATGTPADVLEDPLVVSAYLGTELEAISRSG